VLRFRRTAHRPGALFAGKGVLFQEKKRVRGKRTTRRVLLSPFLNAVLKVNLPEAEQFPEGSTPNPGSLQLEVPTWLRRVTARFFASGGYHGGPRPD